MFHLLVTCGPTGIGKTYQMQRLLREQPERFTIVKSITTRPSRGSEDDAWYRFVTTEEIATLDPADILSHTMFRDESYVILRSEIEAAFARAPAGWMAIVPWIVLRLRELQIPHDLINCRVGDLATYEARLRARGYDADRLAMELEKGTRFEYPPVMEGWPVTDAAFGFSDDDARFDRAIRSVAPSLFEGDAIV